MVDKLKQQLKLLKYNKKDKLQYKFLLKNENEIIDIENID